MRFASSITTSTDAEEATDQLLAPIDGRLTPGMVDFAMLYCTPHFEDELPDVVDRVCTSFPGAKIIGCTAEGTIGVDREIERTPSMSLLCASLPNVSIRPFHLQQQDITATAGPLDWERLVAVSPESNPVFFALADPFRIDIQDFISQINENYPGAPLIGGVASAAHEPGENRLILCGDIHREGIVGVAMTGDVVVESVVSQGCRPIGDPFIITRGERNVIHELGGVPALEQLHSVLEKLSEDDERLARQSLFVGRAIDEHRERFGRGDFLVLNIIGVDRHKGSIGIAGMVRVGSTVQFHVRDADSADEDLRAMLSGHTASDVRGAALFGCNGRGTNMWPQPGHDVGVLRSILGDVPVAGFFCGGEFGPVCGRNFVHGFTASIALFREPAAER